MLRCSWTCRYDFI